jgi:hypothetical protein
MKLYNVNIVQCNAKQVQCRIADLEHMRVPTGKLRLECGSAFRLGGIHRRLADNLGRSRGACSASERICACA